MNMNDYAYQTSFNTRQADLCAENKNTMLLRELRSNRKSNRGRRFRWWSLRGRRGTGSSLAIHQVRS